MKYKQLLTIAFFITAHFILGQTNVTTEQPYIEVAGTAEKEIVPDEIYIQIIIHERYANKVKISIEEQEGKLKNTLKSINIDLSNLYLSDANADYVKIRWQQKDVLTKKDYMLKVSDAKTVGLVFQELEKIEIKDASISRVSHSKIEEFRKEVKILAIKAAKSKADYLLEAIGEQTGKPLIVKENEVLPLSNAVGIAFNSRGYLGDFIGRDDEIQFQKIKVQSSVYVKFLIK